MNLRKVEILMIPTGYAVLVLLAIISTTTRISLSSFLGSGNNTKIEFFKPVIDKLLQRGGDSTFFMSLINNPKTEFNEKYIKINVTGYLKKPDYSHTYNNYSIKKCMEFLIKKSDILDSAEKRFSVPKEVITSILWIESRHGENTGNNHIVSVLLSTAMADQVQYINLNKEIFHRDFDGDSSQISIYETKIIERAAKKSNRAINELLALQRIKDKLPNGVIDLRGSWAGAFGICQFLPSSYDSIAIDGDGDGIINLFSMDDAIFSVANYLEVKGWGATTEQKQKAIFNYNNSDEYVNAVLTLAGKLQENFWRQPLNEQMKVTGKKSLEE
jgi:membrane-bound lytic murein transglycosylase B